jgi:NADH-quinone oxidoreductase subunit H
MENVGIKLAGWVLTVLLAFTVGMFYGGLRRKVIARAQNRVGPPVYQNFLDLLKLQGKVSNISHGWMSHLAPVWVVVAAITTLLFLPVLSGGYWFENFRFEGDLVLILYLMVFGSLGMALGVGQSGNPNGAIGISRGLSLMVGYEIPFVLALVAVMLQGSTSVGQMLTDYRHVHWFAFENPFAFAAALFAVLGMFHYSPFDIISAPAELASGPMSEFGGKYLGTLMTGGSIFSFVKLLLIVDVFLGGAGGYENLPFFWAVLAGLGELLLKTWLLYMIPVAIGIVMPRFRTEQAVTFFWKWPLILGIVGLIWALYPNYF